MKNFDEYIQKTVSMFTHPVWFVTLDKEHTCPCVEEVSTNAKPGCPICFGTGHKLKLTKVMASNQNAQLSYRGQGIAFSEKEIANVYYTKTETAIKAGDIVVDHDDIDIVTDVYYERSDDSKIVYWRIETAPYKYRRDEFEKIFHKTLKEAGFDE